MGRAASLLDFNLHFVQQILHSFCEFTKWLKETPLEHTAIGSKVPS